MITEAESQQQRRREYNLTIRTEFCADNVGEADLPCRGEFAEGRSPGRYAVYYERLGDWWEGIKVVRKLAPNESPPPRPSGFKTLGMHLAFIASV